MEISEISQHNTKNKNPRDIEDYYHVRGLIPANMKHRLGNLNARLVITNYHTFEPKILQGNKRSPLDGKVDLQDACCKCVEGEIRLS